MPSRKRSPAVRWDARGVRALRRHLELSQEKLARELGIRQQTVSEWERGIYQPRGPSRTLLTMVAERAGFSYQASPPEESGKSEDSPPLR